MIEFREISNDEKENIFNYLEDLRDSGQINMFGAAPYVAEAFGINKYQAREILSEWMNNYESMEKRWVNWNGEK